MGKRKVEHRVQQNKEIVSYTTSLESVADTVYPVVCKQDKYWSQHIHNALGQALGSRFRQGTALLAGVAGIFKNFLRSFRL